MPTAAFWLAATVLAVPAALRAQCPPTWSPGQSTTHPVRSAFTLAVFDPDGSGPLPSALMAGGNFDVAGSSGVKVAGYDTGYWQPAGAGAPTGIVAASVVWNGRYVTTATSTNASRVSAWDGSSWQLLGNSTGYVQALAVYNGELIAAGSFTAIGGQSLVGIARWNGTSWQGLGSGLVGSALAMTVFNGSLHVGGLLSQAGGVTVANYALWNGTSWSAGPGCNGAVRSFATRIDSSPLNSWLYAGGEFSQVGAVAANRVVRVNASTNIWSSMPGLPGASCTAITVRSTGPTTFEVVAGIEDASSPQKVWRWTGSAWAVLGTIADLQAVPRRFAVYGGRLQVALSSPASVAGPCVINWDGAQWTPTTGASIDGQVHALSHRFGEAVVGGSFRRVAGTTLNRVARYRFGAWLPLGTGCDGPVHAIAHLANGDVVAGGSFTNAGGAPASGIARWNGFVWAPLGTGLDGPVRALLPLPDGSVIVGGDFVTAGGIVVNRIARWTGTAWQSLGVGADCGFDQPVLALAALPDGTIAVGGAFTRNGTVPAGPSRNHVARWNGTAWSDLGSGLDGIVRALTAMPDGLLVAGGEFLTAGPVAAVRLARWQGGAWQADPRFAPGATVRALAAAPGGVLFVGLDPAPGSTNLVRLGPDGSVELQALSGESVQALVFLSSGSTLAGGAFLAAGGVPSINLAQRNSGCPATVGYEGLGCLTSAGYLTLGGYDGSWIGSTCRGSALTFAPGSLAFDLVGFQSAATPLSALHPAGVAGCDLLVDWLVTQLLVPVAGVASTQITIPYDTSFVGMVLRQQVLALEFAGGNLTRLAGSNALRWTVGLP